MAYTVFKTNKKIVNCSDIKTGSFNTVFVIHNFSFYKILFCTAVSKASFVFIYTFFSWRRNYKLLVNWDFKVSFFYPLVDICYVLLMLNWQSLWQINGWKLGNFTQVYVVLKLIVTALFDGYWKGNLLWLYSQTVPLCPCRVVIQWRLHPITIAILRDNSAICYPCFWKQMYLLWCKSLVLKSDFHWNGLLA